MLEIIIICLIGGIAGWIAGVMVDSDNKSVLIDILIGIVGGYIGYHLFGYNLSITPNIWVNKTLTSIALSLIHI